MKIACYLGLSVQQAISTLAAQSQEGAELLRAMSFVPAKTVNFMYGGKLRVVEVHAIGLSPKDGSLVMRGYQVAGVASRPLPQWTLFSVAKMENLTLGKEDSLAPREGYSQGDAQMQTVFAEIAL